MSDIPSDVQGSNRVGGWADDQIRTMVRWLLYMVFVVIGFTILSEVAALLTPLLAAAGIAYLLDPVVDRLEAKGMSRTWAVTLLLVTFLATVTIALILLIPLIITEVTAFINDAPTMLENGKRWLAARLGHDEVPKEWNEMLNKENVQAAIGSAAGPLAAMAKAAVGGIFSLLAFLAHALMIPVFAFYFLVDWDNMMSRSKKMIPRRHESQVVDILKEIDSVVSGWIRGQLTVTTILAILYAIAFKVLDVPMGLTIGFLVGGMTIIPFLGTIVGAALTMLLLLLDYQGAGQIAGVGGVFVVLHLLEAAVLTPKIVGHRVGLSEVAALFAVVAGGTLLGFFGILLAVPLAASIAVLVRRAYGAYEKSEFYQTDTSTTAEAVGVGEVALEAAQVDTEADTEETKGDD